jgi:hypothetical protein
LSDLSWDVQLDQRHFFRTEEGGLGHGYELVTFSRLLLRGVE